MPGVERRAAMLPMRLLTRRRSGSMLRASVIALSALAGAAAAVAQPAAGDKQIASLLAEQKWAEALTLIDTQLKTRPNDAQLLMNRGAVLSNLNRNNDALAAFQKVATLNPQLPAVHNNIAVIQAAMGKYEEARASLERAIRTHPTYATAYENLGDLYSHMAGDAYRKALQIDKNLKSAKPKLEMVTELTAMAAGAPSPAAAATASRPASPVPPEPTTVAQAGPASPPAAAPAAPKPAPEPAKAAAPTAAPAAASRAPAPAPAATPAPAAASATATPPTAAPTKPAAAPAAAPAPAPAAAPSPATNPAEAPATAVADVEAALKAWARAWSARDVAAYQAAYTSDFKGSASSHAEWLSDRRARIEARSRISVNVSDIKVKINGDRAEVSFLQAYSSDGPSARSRKSIGMQKVGGKWLIRQESGR